MFYRDVATLMYFNYKTTKKIVYKKKILEGGGSRMIEKDDQFNPPDDKMKEGKFEKVEKTIDVWYDGIMVMGTNILLKWEVAHNMVRPKSASQHAMPNYVATAPRMYKGVIESLVRRMIPFADLIQITHLKLQQVIARTVPDGVYIDADGLNEVDLGTGNAYNPEDALRLYFQTGSVIGRSFTQDGEFNNARVPIQELTSNSGAAKTQMLIGNMNHYLQMIRDVTGLNEARDGSAPDPHSLVGLQKLAAANSNTATRHILDGSLYMFRTLAEALTYRVSDILEYADFKDEFVNQIGKYNVSILQEINELYLYDFGIFIEVSPDEEQRQQLEANIQASLANGGIDLEDAIDIREIKNIKLANQLLKIKREAKQEEERTFQLQQQEMQSQANMQSQAQAKAQLMEREFQYNLQLHGMQEQQLQMREDKREGAKSNRISQQNTEQSKLIDQRKNNLPPMNFESNEDSLDGFDLAEFSPR
jgi:hypothetical protein